MSGFVTAILNRSRTVLSVLVLVLVAGAFAYNEIPKESDPDVNIPIIYVALHHEGISPQDADRLLVRPMETELRSVEGVKEMRATAYEGGANVTLEFEAGFDPDVALADVREKVDVAKIDLPEETDDPSVNEVNLSLFPVLVVILSGDVSERVLLRLARDLQDEIEGIPTVLKADIAGDRDEVVEIVIDPVVLESYGIDTQDVLNNIGRNNQLVAAGALDTGRGRFSVKVPGLFESLNDILNMPVKVEGDAAVTLRDIAEVRRTFEDPEGFARVNGRFAIALEVSKRTGANIIETIERVRGVTEEMRATWPDAVKVSYSQDKSDNIRVMLTDLQNNVISAVLLVMIVIVAALGLRSGLLVGVAVPGSFLTGILVLSTLGLTVNIVVLFSLILSVGMLVDGAIVVTEYADRKMSEGEPPMRAYGMASSRMAAPIIASTMTTLAAFLPLLFWPGIVGEFMKFLPITLIATLSASLFMALIFIPTLGAHFGRPGDPNGGRQSLAAGDDGNLADLVGFTGAYVRFLRGALQHPLKVIGVAVALLVGVQWTYATYGRGVEFFPNVEPELAVVDIHARGNLSIWESDALVKEVEDRILGVPGIDTVYSRTGGASREQEKAEDVIGSIQLELADWKDRPPFREIQQRIEARMGDLAGVFVEFREEEAGPPVGKDVQIELSSIDPDLLPEAVAIVRAGLDQIGGFVNIEDDRPVPGIEWEMTVDRAQAAKFGVDVSLVGSTVQLVTRGLKLGEYRPNDSREEIDIRARFPEEFRSVSRLDTVRIGTAEGQIPVGNFVERAPQPKTGILHRVDARPVMRVKADVAEGLLPDDKVRAIRAWLPDSGIDPRIRVAFKGEDEEQKEAEAFLMRAFGIALFIMGIILVTQFNSFYSAFLILTAVVMSTIGVMMGLLAVGQPFGIVMSGIGVIALAGIVVNNNIVLIDTFDRLRATATSPVDAILRTGAQRLRPVLLTTITTVLGLMPMVLQTNIDFVTREISIGAPSTQWWVQLSTAIVFGLSFATLLTLVFTPSALMVRENFRIWKARRWPPAPEPEPEKPKPAPKPAAKRKPRRRRTAPQPAE